MFELNSVEFSTITRLIMQFNDTVHPTDSRNFDPNNYIITGGAKVTGNIVIAGSTISCDIALAAEGFIYDVQLSNLVSAQLIILTPARVSFYFGAGVITPYLINTNTLGELYMINDSALVGKL